MKIKVIEISHSSESYALGEGEKELKKLVLNDWPARTARQTKKFYPEIEVECWAPERIYKEEKQYVEGEILFRFFPTTIAVRYGLDFSMQMLKELKREIEKSKRENYKLIIKIHEVHNLHGLLIASFFKDQNLIVQHHGGSWPVKHLSESRKKKFFFPLFYLAQILENSILKNVKYFYALSEKEINYLKQRAPDSMIKFQTMGIEDEYYKSVGKKTARKKLKIPDNKKVILYIGRIAEIKGAGFLLEAMKKMKYVELKCIGFGPEEKKFKDYAKENNLKNVEFLGGVFGEKKILYLNAANAFVLPSLKEGAPVTVMEALACNTPVVVTEIGGVPMMIENGREGIIIKKKSPEDIVRGIKEILRWKNKNVKQYADKYRWKKIIEATVRDYREI